MAQNNDNEMNVIDEYYKNRENANPSVNPDINTDPSDFEKKLNLSMVRMDTIPDDIYDMNVNILGIIAEGEKIREKKDKREFLIFAGVALSLITLLIFLTLSVNEKIFVYYQIAAFIVIPFSLIPLTNSALKKEV